MTTTETTTWWQRAHADSDAHIAYFSMEFALSDELPIYSGGLGVLAGDHLKAAAELGIPFVGVGLLYRTGYFHQSIDDAGRQAERYEPVDPAAAGLVRESVHVDVELDGDTIHATIWRKDIGSVTLYLLEAEGLTDALYSGDRTHRIRQELLLGVGGVRALAALGVEANVFHMNEGHSAFLAIERVRALVEVGVPTDEAIAQVKRTSVFTTHTPVPAGNEIFDEELVTHYVGPLAGGCRPTRTGSRSCTARSHARCGPRSRRSTPRSGTSRTACTSRRGSSPHSFSCSATPASTRRRRRPRRRGPRRASSTTTRSGACTLRRSRALPG